jgi:hypothetical protein
MRDFVRLSSKAWRLWFDTMQAGVAAFATVATRLPILATDGAKSPEATRMVNEKLAAAAEGAVKASIAGATATGRAMTGIGPVAAASGALSIADAMTGPARRRVKANAKRLTKRRKNPSKKR